MNGTQETYHQSDVTSATTMKYKTMFNEVHIDEKWIYLVIKDGGKYILAAHEVDHPPI
jgi:hypothetical protein